MKVLVLRGRLSPSRPSEANRASAGARLCSASSIWSAGERFAADYARLYDSGWWATIRTALCEHIGGVFFVRAEKEMVRVHAQRRVAAVAYQAKVSLRYLAMRQLVRRSMRVCRLAVDPELAVPVSADCSGPKPAFIVAGNRRVFRKTRDWVSPLVVVAALLRAELADLRDVVGHLRAAVRARSRDLLRPYAESALGVARMSAETTRLARSAHEQHAAGCAPAFDMGGI